ncbi:peptidase A1 family protein [Pleurotus pulmonarius]
MLGAGCSKSLVSLLACITASSTSTWSGYVRTSCTLQVSVDTVEDWSKLWQSAERYIMHHPLMWSQGALLITAIAGSISQSSALRVPLSRREFRASLGRQVYPREADISSNRHAFILHNSQDILYAGNITIGGQNIIVSLDTGSADLWAYLPDRRPQLTNSTSIVGNLTYAVGSAEGPINFAALEFAGFSVPSQAFIDVAQTADMDGVFAGGASGLLGLGFDATNSVINEKFEQAFGSATTLGRSPIANIFYQNMTLPNFFTLLLGRTDDPDDERAGVFTISEYIPEFSAVGDTPKLTSQTIEHWSVLVDGVNVGNQSLPFNSSVATTPNGKAIAVLDSGFSLPPIPSALVDAIYGAIPGSACVSDVSAFAGSLIEWIVPCNQSTEVSFSIGGRNFPIHPIDFTSIATMSLNGTNVTYCFNTYQSITFGDGEFDMILGDAFLKNAYVSFDYGSFDDQGHLTEKPFIQLLPTTDSKEAWAEFIAIRAKALEGAVEFAPSEFRVLVMQEDADADEPDAPTDEASEISGVLASPDNEAQDGPADSTATAAIQKYGPVVIGLLAGNLLILIVICALGLYFCISKGGRNGKTASASYHPVKLQKGDSQFTEPVFETRYDS